MAGWAGPLLDRPITWRCFSLTILFVSRIKPAPRAPTVACPNTNQPPRVVGFVDMYPKRVDSVFKLGVNEVGSTRCGGLRTRKWSTPNSSGGTISPPGAVVAHDEGLGEVAIGGELAWPAYVVTYKPSFFLTDNEHLPTMLCAV